MMKRCCSSTAFARSASSTVRMPLLDNFRIAYQDALAEIAKVHGSLKELDLFPAVPAPVAVLCGRETLPKIHPALRVYDYDKTQGGFTYQLTVNS
jgi:hypothetical protein